MRAHNCTFFLLVLHVCNQIGSLDIFYGNIVHWIWEVTSWCLNRHFFYQPFSADLHYNPLISPVPFLLRPPCLPSCFMSLKGLCIQQVVSGYRDVESLESQIGTHGSCGHIYMKQVIGWQGWCCSSPLLNIFCLYVCKSDCQLLFTICGKRPVAFFFYYLLSHSPILPLSVSNCLSRLYSWLSLYIWSCCSLCAWRWDCHGYCDLLSGWQRGWKP